jgi:hypothetical protein
MNSGWPPSEWLQFDLETQRGRVLINRLGSETTCSEARGAGRKGTLTFGVHPRQRVGVGSTPWLGFSAARKARYTSLDSFMEDGPPQFVVSTELGFVHRPVCAVQKCLATGSRIRVSRNPNAG